MSTMPVVAVVGRVNVGKSTLFNRMVGGRLAIVDDAPGVTRDRNMAPAHWAGSDFFVIDTGGLAPGTEDGFQEGIERQVRLALSESDAVVLVVDVTTGIHPYDTDAAEMVRRSGLPAFLAVNKADNDSRLGMADEFYALGLGKPWPVSALHGYGTGDLLDEVVSVLERTSYEEGDELSLAVVGRPNVGKSSLVNRLCGSERNLVTPKAGTTRDATDTLVEWKGRTVRLVDTAGLRRKSRRMDDVEFYSTVRAWKALSRGDVVLVMMDGSEHPTQQDIRIAARAWEMGKGVLVAVNKVDLGVERELWAAALVERFAAARWMPLLFVSALTGEGVRDVLPRVVAVGERRRSRMPTSELNAYLEEAVEAVQPPSPGGRAVRLLYATQVGSEPPTVVIFVNRPGDLPENYRRYIESSLRERMGLRGSPLRVLYRRRKH